jgi:hypothetical protein
VWAPPPPVLVFQVLFSTSARIRLKPITTTTNATRDHTVERTVRIFVHSARSSPGQVSWAGASAVA